MSKIKIANAPCSWGSLEFDGLEGEAIGYVQMLDELAETGYAGTELGDWGYMPTDPAELTLALEQRGLTMLGAFVPVALVDADAHEAGRAQACKTAGLLAEVAQRQGNPGEPFLVLADDNGSIPARVAQAGRISQELSLQPVQWDVFAQGAQSIAQGVKDEAGLRTVFHHHCAGYVETPDEIDALLQRTDPDLLGLVFDTGHFVYGAGDNDIDLIAQLDRFAERIWYVHFKDCHPQIASRARHEGLDYFAAVQQGVFCELGQGCVDFPAVLQWLETHTYEGWIVVEQDVLPGMGAPKQSAQRNRAYLHSIGL